MSKGNFLNECYLQKVNQYDALKILSDEKEALSLGKELNLDMDEDNEGKKGVVAKLGDSIIGFLSEDDSKIIRKFLNAGWVNSLFECRISKVDEEADENKRYSVVIKILEHQG